MTATKTGTPHYTTPPTMVNSKLSLFLRDTAILIFEGIATGRRYTSHVDKAIWKS